MPSPGPPFTPVASSSGVVPSLFVEGTCKVTKMADICFKGGEPPELGDDDAEGEKYLYKGLSGPGDSVYS